MNVTCCIWSLVKVRTASSIIRSCAFSPDGRLAASAGWDKRLRLWEVSTCREVSPPTVARRQLRECRFTPDGRYLVIRSDPVFDMQDFDGTVSVWNVETWKSHAILGRHERSVQAFDISPDGAAIATASDDGTL